MIPLSGWEEGGGEGGGGNNDRKWQWVGIKSGGVN